MPQKAEIVRQYIEKNIESKKQSLDKNKKLLEEAQSKGEVNKVEIYDKRVKEIEKRIDSLQKQLNYIRDDNYKDLAEREEARKSFSKQVSEVIPDGVPMVFHGNNDISAIHDIIASGGLKTPEEQGIDFKSFATQIDVANKFDIHVPVEFAEPMSSAESCRPYGAIFAFYPKEEEMYKGLNNYGSEVPGGVQSIDFKEERFIGIITTEENKERIQRWLKECKMDSSRVFTHSEFIQMCKEKFKEIGSSGLQQPSRNYIAQTDPEIKLSSSYINYTEFQRTDDGKTQTEKRKSPLLNEEKQVIGESEEIEVYDYETGITTRNRYETIEGENGVFSVDTKTVERGESFSVHSTMTVFNEVSKCKEKSEYIRDESGNETYTYMENGRIGQKITRTARGTTIDIFKDGQPYATYEYDENGKAIIPMGKMEQLPENYVEYSFKVPIPEYSEISHQEPSKSTVDTQRLGKETLDMQKDTRRIDEVEQQMSEQMREQTMQENATVRINEFGKIIRTGNTQQSFRESMRFDVSSNEYAQETLRKFTQDLESGTLENVDSKKKDSHKVEKGDDDYVM